MPIGVLVSRKIGAKPIVVRVQAMVACRDVIRSAPNPKIRNSDAEKGIADFGRRQQEAKLERDMAADLKEREIVILEPVVDVGFGQHDKKSDQRDAGQEIGRRE